MVWVFKGSLDEVGETGVLHESHNVILWVLKVGTSTKSATALFSWAQLRVALQRGPFTQHLGSALLQPAFPRSFYGQGRHSLRGSFCG